METRQSKNQLVAFMTDADLKQQLVASADATGESISLWVRNAVRAKLATESGGLNVDSNRPGETLAA